MNIEQMIDEKLAELQAEKQRKANKVKMSSDARERAIADKQAEIMAVLQPIGIIPACIKWYPVLTGCQMQFDIAIREVLCKVTTYASLHPKNAIEWHWTNPVSTDVRTLWNNNAVKLEALPGEIAAYVASELMEDSQRTAERAEEEMRDD